jgi:putative membrane protein
MLTEKRDWFRVALQFQGSVIPSVLGRTEVCGVFGVLVSVLHHFNWPVSLPILASLIPNIVLGLLLVFRTNTAYERFWEGRKLWGTMVNTSRNLARQLWVAIAAKTLEDRENKITALRLLVAFAVATKLNLRQQSVNPELEALMPPARYFKLKALGGCERILKTPIPMAYAIHLKQLLLLYCLSLPFQMVSQLGWWTGPMVALISFTLFGIEEIGIEIENPFGCDRNDLPLDSICNTMLRNIEDLISLTPNSERYEE